MTQRLDQKIEEDRQKFKEDRQKWAKNDKQWDENQRLWAENQRQWDEKREEDRQKWEENQKQWEENQKQWAEKREEDRQKWEENQKQWAEKREEDRLKWAENQQQMEQTRQEIRKVFSKVEQKLGAIGARWGIQSEASFRNALAGILQEFEDIQVIHVDEHDDQGIVFGYPEEIELDLIIKNGVLMIAEMKASVEKVHIAIFEKKVRFYEQKHNRQASKKIVISPNVDQKALTLANQFGIEIYTYAEDIV